MIADWRCGACGALAAARSFGCPVCGVQQAWVWNGVGRAAMNGATLPARIRVVQTGDPELDRHLWSESVEGELGGLAVPCSILVGGPAGVGKSTLTARWGGNAAAALGSACLVVCWESMAEVAMLAVQRSGAAVSGIWVSERGDWAGEARRVGARVVVVDSVSVAEGEGAEPSRIYAELKRCARWAAEHEGIVIGLSQVTESGALRGGPAIVHKPDAVFKLARVSAGSPAVEVSIEKCRWAPSSKCTVLLG